MTKFISIIAFSFLLIGCAPTLSSYEMMPKAQMYDALDTPKAFQKNISVGEVIVDKGMGGMTAPISSEGYRDALTSSLRLAGWYKAEGARYRLDAHLKEVDQPVIGFNFTVTTKASYVLTDIKTNKEKYNDQLTLPCTVTMAEAFIADQRLRKATSCAVGENIAHLLNTLSEQ